MHHHVVSVWKFLSHFYLVSGFTTVLVFTQTWLWNGIRQSLMLHFILSASLQILPHGVTNLDHRWIYVEEEGIIGARGRGSRDLLGRVAHVLTVDADIRNLQITFALKQIQESMNLNLTPSSLNIW